MQVFEYLAVDAQGRDCRGVLEGDTERQVRQRLRELGLTPLDVRTADAQAPQQTGAHSRARIGAATLALLTRQLATLVASGTSVENALGAVARQASGRIAKGVLLGVRGQVLEGRALADALAAYPGIFDALYCASVAAGERTGTLGAVLESLASHLESVGELRRSVGTALVYPIVLVSVALLLLAALLAWVVPQVVQVFAGSGQALPWLTRVVIAISDLLREHAVLLLLGVVLIAAGGRALLARATVRHRVHALCLRMPVIARLVRAVNSARLAGTLAILANSGVALVDALAIAARVVSNLPMRRAVHDAAQRVAQGESLSAALARGTLFPPVMIELIASGEGGGQLDVMLARAARSQEQDARALAATALALLEPLLTLMMGLFVLLIILAILLPLFELNRLIGV